MAWAADHLFGPSAVSLRVLPALAGGASAFITAGMARELGGERRAQVLAALAAATLPQVLGATHLLSTAAFDIFFWACITWLVLRLLRTNDQRLWLALGAVSGVALLNKHNVLFLLGALGVALLVSRRDVLRGPWPWVGAVVALVIWSPNVIWNAQHDWVTFRHVGWQAGVQQREGVHWLGPLAFVGGQRQTSAPIITHCLAQ